MLLSQLCHMGHDIAWSVAGFQAPAADPDGKQPRPRLALQPGRHAYLLGRSVEEADMECTANTLWCTSEIRPSRTESRYRLTWFCRVSVKDFSLQVFCIMCLRRGFGQGVEGSRLRVSECGAAGRHCWQPKGEIQTQARLGQT